MKFSESKKRKWLVLLLSIGASLPRIASGNEQICTSANNAFTVKVDLFASELGYYQFEECGDQTNPTIGMEIDQMYTFIQLDRSNYFHPLGFAYGPDGVKGDNTELEPGTSAPGSTTGCAATLTCPAPMYFINGTYQGAYSNIDAFLPATIGEADFGLESYEQKFCWPIDVWNSLGHSYIHLKFDDESYAEDLFYFCHIHQYMSGRIKLLKNGVPINSADTPELGYEYDVPGEFDQTCGSFDLDRFQVPNDKCPQTFVCNADETVSDVSDSLRSYSSCINAANCAMLQGMTNGISAESPVALFIHQMIPHHQNAVNMAKTLLQTGKLYCADVSNTDDQDCILENILRQIINVQNAQIQVMRQVLRDLDYPMMDNCDVFIESSSIVAIDASI